MNTAKLPEYCYGTLPSTGEVVIIKRGEMGYYSSNATPGNAQADDLNAVIGVTKAQAEAMMSGSMFGWDIPSADPDNYDQDGRFIFFAKENALHPCLKLTMRRQGYRFSHISETMTVGDLISELRRYPKDLPIVLSLDDGCTIGGLTDEDISEEEVQ